MRIAIIAKSGPATGRRIVLRGGQIARIGRTDWADFALPEDHDLADVHFSIHCGINSAIIQALALDRETKLNGNPTEKAEIHHDDVIEAGATRFHVEVEGATPTANSVPIDGIPVNATKPSLNENETREIADYIGLSEESLEVAKVAADPKRFGETLVQGSLLKDALCWYAHTLPKPKAVLWACSCVGDTMQSETDTVQLAAYQAAKQWANEPNESNRQSAAQLADACKYEGVGGILAAAAGWSGGSLGPSNQPDVPPDDRLTARCICAALTIADSLGNPLDSSKRLHGFITRLKKPHTSHPLP
ncbi:MAG: FHA domain-containing protein [Pirellula sp.]